MMNRSTFASEYVARQEMIQGVAVSPDGATVVYALRITERDAYRSSLWVIDVDSRTSRPLTDGTSIDTAPTFSPDGTRVLFLSDRGGSVQPWTVLADGGDATQVAALPVGVQSAQWSPDGERVLAIAYSGEDRFVVGDGARPVTRRIDDITYRSGEGFRDQFTSAWIVDVASGENDRVTRADHEVFDAAWRDDSSFVVIADLERVTGSRERPQAHLVQRADDGPRYQPLPALDGDMIRVACSPTGQVAVLAYERPNASWSNVGLFVLGGERFVRLARDVDRSFQLLSYSDIVPSVEPQLTWDDEDALLVTMAVDGRSHPCRVTLDGAVTILADGDLVACEVAANSGRRFVLGNIGGAPGELYEIVDEALIELTRAGAWMAGVRRDAEEFRFRSSSGSGIQAWVLRPPGSAPGPTILHLHGGPHSCHGPTPWLEMLALVELGISVIYPNFKGSGGFGEAYAADVVGNWGLADGQEVVDLAQWAVDSGIAQQGRIGVMGCSYGGFMTTWLMGHYPGVFAAGISENPVTDLIGLYGEGDQGAATSELAVGADARLPEDVSEFLERSPFAQLHQNVAPLLLLQADLDLRSPAGQSELAFAVMQSRGIRCELVRYPDESHMMLRDGRPDRRVDRIDRITRWFEEHL